MNRVQETGLDEARPGMNAWPITAAREGPSMGLEQGFGPSDQARGMCLEQGPLLSHFPRRFVLAILSSRPSKGSEQETALCAAAAAIKVP
jgi:hypothetical protein